MNSSAYTAPTSSLDSIEALSSKLSADLRHHIRRIELHPVLSEQWLAMADTAGRIATVSEAEGKLPREHEEATLWETEEAALRFVLEDGKVSRKKKEEEEDKKEGWVGLLRLLTKGEERRGEQGRGRRKSEGGFLGRSTNCLVLVTGSWWLRAELEGSFSPSSF